MITYENNLHRRDTLSLQTMVHQAVHTQCRVISSLVCRFPFLVKIYFGIVDDLFVTFQVYCRHQVTMVSISFATQNSRSKLFFEKKIGKTLNFCTFCNSDVETIQHIFLIVYDSLCTARFKGYVITHHNTNTHLKTYRQWHTMQFFFMQEP